MSDAALIAALAGLVPLMAVIAWTDLRDMRIPNWAVLAVFGVFLATGIWGLPLETFLWRLGYAAIVFAAGLLLYNIAQGGIGAGDLKLLAALTPFLAGAILLDFMIAYVLVSLVGTAAFIIARRMLKGRETGMKALDRGRYFPAGIFIGVAVVAVMAKELYGRFGA